MKNKRIILENRINRIQIAKKDIIKYCGKELDRLDKMLIQTLKELEVLINEQK